MRLAWWSMPAVVMALSLGVLEEWLRPDPVFDPPPPLRHGSRQPSALDVDATRRVMGFRPAGPVTARPPSSPPSLRLLGTLASSVAGRSLAAVDAPSLRVATLGVGDVFDGWEVAHIGHGRVVLVRGEEQVELTARPGPSWPTPARELLRSPPVRTFERAELMKTIDAATPTVMRTTRVEPLLEHGAFAGVRLSFPPDSPLRQLGLEPGDAVRQVNGQPLTPELGLSLMRSLSSLRRLDAQVERGGRTVMLGLEVQ